jgi:hypothetical protein
MRKWLIPLCLLPATFCACTASFPTVSAEDSWRLHVECRNDLSVRQSVLFMMRQGRPKDIKEDATSAMLVIEAAYYKADNPVQLMQKIASDLKTISLASEVYFEENHAPVRQMP